MSHTKSEVKYYAVNVCDLSTLKPVERLLVQDKISSRQVIHVNSEIDGSAVILQSTIKSDYSRTAKNKQISQLKATCELLWKYSRVRSYYSKNGKKFYRLRF